MQSAKDALLPNELVIPANVITKDKHKICTYTCKAKIMKNPTVNKLNLVKNASEP